MSNLSHYFTLGFWTRFWEDALTTMTARGLHLLAVLLFYVIARRGAARLIDAALNRFVARQGDRGAGDDRLSRLRTLQGLIKSLVSYVLLFVFAVMLLTELGVNVSGIITTAGVGGVAFAFGAQKLVRDVISGFFLIVEDQFGVGEYVTIGPATGVVEELGMRITRIRDDQGRLWILANGDVSTVTNHSRAPVCAFIDVGIAPTAPLDRAQQEIDAACRELYEADRRALAEAPHTNGVSAFDAARTAVRVDIVAEPRALAAEQLRVREAILERLRKAEIPVA